MLVTTIANLKASLSELLAGVKAGEEVVVTDRGRPVARIVPYDPGGAELDDLVRSGQVRRSQGSLPARFWEQPGPPDAEGRLLGDRRPAAPLNAGLIDAPAAERLRAPHP